MKWTLRWNDKTKKVVDLGQWGITILLTVIRAIPLFFGFNLTLVDIIIFLLLDVATALLQSYCVSRIIWLPGQRIWWASVAVLCFIAPYVYVIAVGNNPPMYVYIILGVWVAAMAILATMSVVKKLRTNVASE